MKKEKILTAEEQIKAALNTYYTADNINKNLASKEYESSYCLGWLKRAVVNILLQELILLPKYIIDITDEILLKIDEIDYLLTQKENK